MMLERSLLLCSKYLKQLCIEEEELLRSIFFLNMLLFALLLYRCLVLSSSSSGGFLLLFLLRYWLRFLLFYWLRFLLLCWLRFLFFFWLRFLLHLAAALIFSLDRLTIFLIVVFFYILRDRGRWFRLPQASFVGLHCPLIDHYLVCQILVFFFTIKIIIGETHQRGLEGEIDPNLIVKLEQRNETFSVGALEPGSSHSSPLSIIFYHYLRISLCFKITLTFHLRKRNREIIKIFELRNY